MSDHPTPAPRAPEAERPEGTGTNIYLQEIEYLTARARAAEEELERVRGAAREVIAAFRWMDQCRGKGIAWRREKPAYEGLKAAVDRAGSQGEGQGGGETA